MAHILLIDDEAQLRTLYRKIIEAAGHRVTDASDGAAGLDAFRQDRPDLVIADVVMPQTDGIQMIRQMCAEVPEIKVIVISGGTSFPTSAFLQIGLTAGAARALAKPFTPSKLLGVVDELLARWRKNGEITDFRRRPV
jgi:DNA-binding response OmpR family regulator